MRTAWLLACFLLMGAAPDSERRRFTWPEVAVVKAVEVPETLRAQGVPIKIRAVMVKGRLEDLYAVHLKAFTRAGLYLGTQGTVPGVNEPTLAALDPETLVTYAVVFQRGPSGVVTLVLSEAALGQRQPAAGASVAPVFPGATNVLRFEQEGVQLLGFETRAAKTEVLDYYRTTLGATGFAQRRDGESTQFTRKGEELKLELFEGHGGARSVLLTHRRVTERAP